MLIYIWKRPEDTVIANEGRIVITSDYLVVILF